uniref:Transposon protein, putative, CACTA, En/Spm sub-class n=1 Tax=Oryza sativa subsp. japonica TaxID=39947 RepID=Q2QSK0_ORYSJ|nr:transposon protein, putative, CACTA, En/Spm sub-class [Oryza sativa Japonica Group]
MKTSENEGTNVNENKRTNMNENERTNMNELGNVNERTNVNVNMNANMADRDEEQILYDTIAEGSSQYWNEEEGNEDPNQYLNEEGNVERDAEGNQQGHVERDVEGNQEEEASGSQPSVGQKRARGQRGAAKKLEGRHIITEVEEDGRHSAPAEAAKNYVRHSGWVVRDNVPVSTVYWRRTRARGDHESFVPDSEKEMLWTTMLETFTLPAGTEDKVKRWTLKKMAEQFQSFKGDLYQKYILKGQTPNFDTFPKLRDHWDEFVAYKTGEQGQAMMERNKENAAKKKYHHHLGSGGYSIAMPKWEEMEASLIERGIEPAIANWPERSKFWYYAHGGTLNPADGSLVFGDQIREAARRLTDAVEASSQGTFRPDRDRDELTLALQTPEHPGRTRGKGVIPWKIGFKEDIHTYRSRMRSKRDIEAKIADLEFRVSSYELNMQEEVARKVDERMAAHRSHDPQPTIPPAMVSPSGNRSSCASTGQVGSQSMDAMQTHDESTCPVDDITQRTPCELHIPFKNLSIKVASGMAIPTDPSGTYHCRPIPAGYSKVEVELVEGAYEDLELDYPGGDGSCTVSSSCSASIVSTSGSSTDSSSGSCTDSSSGSYTYSSASSSSGTFKVKGPPAPPPAHKKATKKAKVDAAKNKDPGYDCTQEELDAYVALEVKRQFKPRSPEKKISIDPSVRNFFRGMSAPVKEAIKLSDYERTLKKASSGKSKPVPQLGEQPNQEIEPLVTWEDMTIEEFIIDTGLTTDQLLGVEPIEKAELKYMYELGKPLVKPELVQSLPTQMYKFYQLYMEMSATGREMIGARIRDPDFLQGDDILWINFKGIYEVYQLDALDVSIMSCWILFHWVLLLFDLSACTVNVYDSMDKKESTFDKVFELIDSAQSKSRELTCAATTCFIRMRDNLTTHKEFIAAVQEQLMGFINEEILDPKGEFYYDGNTIHRSLASELAATTTTSKS